MRARMADSVDPTAIPALFAAKPNGVAPYHDGLYAWPHRQIERFPRVWRITVLGGKAAAPHCRVMDVERFDLTPADVQPYQLERAELGEATMVYCDRDNVHLVVDADPHWQDLEWWLATLDGIAWTPFSIAAWLWANYKVRLDPGKIKAIQNRGMGGYDQSDVFGDPGWAKG